MGTTSQAEPRLYNPNPNPTNPTTGQARTADDELFALLHLEEPGADLGRVGEEVPARLLRDLLVRLELCCFFGGVVDKGRGPLGDMEVEVEVESGGKRESHTGR